MKILRNIIAVVGGWIIGSAINLGVLELGPMVITYPEGFDNSTMEALAETIHLLGPIHYVVVFLAHGLGALFGAFAAAKIAATKKNVFAFVIGGFFLMGGIASIFMIPSPTWYIAVDLLLAYIPMAWIGWKLAGGHK